MSTLTANALPELVYAVGPVALVPYETPGTQALADLFTSLRVAHQRMESLEHAARILLAARAVGRVIPFKQPEW